MLPLSEQDPYHLLSIDKATSEVVAIHGHGDGVLYYTTAYLMMKITVVGT